MPLKYTASFTRNKAIRIRHENKNMLWKGYAIYALRIRHLDKATDETNSKRNN